MGNGEFCVGNRKTLVPEESDKVQQRETIQQSRSSSTVRKSAISQQNITLKNTFLYDYNTDLLISLSSNIDPYSHKITKRILQLHSIIGELQQLHPYPHLKQLYLKHKILRCILMLNNCSLKSSVDCILEDITFKLSQPQQVYEEGQHLREAIQFVGLDFKNSLCLLIRINRLKGTLKIQTIQQFLIYFIDTLWYEVAKSNQLNNQLNILLDFDSQDLNVRFLQFLVDLTTRHYFMIISSIYVVNVNLETISSETSSILQSQPFQTLTYIFNKDYTNFLPRYIKKSTLLKQYGGKCDQMQQIPMTIDEAQNTQL